MKNCIIALVILLSTLYVHAQKVGDTIPNVKFHQWNDLNGFSYLHRVNVTSENLISPKKLEYHKKYDRIEFMHYGKKLWLSGKHVKGGYGYKEFKNPSPFRYVENDALFAQEPADKGGWIPKYVPIYHANGQLWYEDKKWGSDSQPQFSNVVFNEDGSLYRQFTYYHVGKTNHPIFGDVDPVMVTPIPGYTPNYQSYPNGVSFMGYQHVGTLYTNEGWEITGFITSLQTRFGNGGVFFIANRSTGMCYWATIVNFKIVTIEPADCREKPDLQELDKAWDVKQYAWNIDAWSKSKMPDEAKRAFLVPEQHMDKKMYFELDVLRVNEKIDKMPDGYQVRIIPVTNRLGEDGSMVEIGLFKDGKLHGQGFTARIDYYPSLVNVNNKSKSAEIKFNSARWDMMAGTFENGKFKQGREFSTEYAYNFDLDLFTQPAFENFDFTGKNVKKMVKDRSIPINLVSPNTYLYVKSLKRVLNIKAVDKTRGIITVATDRPGFTHDFQISTDDVYVWDTRVQSYQEACPKTINVPVYREKQVLLYTLPGETKMSQYRVAMVNGTKVTTTWTQGEGKPVYGTKRELDHYETKTCGICYGSGTIYKERQAGGYALVVFK